MPALKRYLSFRKDSFDKERRQTLLLFFWFFLPFLFFSCIGKKLVPYILPLLAPLAVIIARLWNEAMDKPRILATKIFAVSFYIFLLSLGLLCLGMIGFLILGFDYKLGVEATRPNIIAMIATLAVAIIVSISFFRSKKPAKLFWTITLSSALFFLATIDLMPKIETATSKSIKNLALKIKEDLRPEDKVVNYRCFLKSLPFYLARRTIVVERQRNIAYEESPKQWQDYLLEDKEELYRLLSRTDFKVYCITYTWEFEKIKEEYPKRLYFLGKARKYVLFANKK